MSYGVTGAGSDEQWRKLMEFSKVLGIGVIQIEAGNDRANLDRAEKAADEFKIKVAIHNHTQAEGLPAAVLKQLEGRGKNIGAGSDIGHWMCANTRPLDGVRLLKGKFVSMHLVDVEAIAANPSLRAVPYGAGAGEIAAVLDELKAQGYKGFVTSPRASAGSTPIRPASSTRTASCPCPASTRSGAASPKAASPPRGSSPTPTRSRPNSRSGSPR